jgi:hypothetical protein
MIIWVSSYSSQVFAKLQIATVCRETVASKKLSTVKEVEIYVVVGDQKPRTSDILVDPLIAALKQGAIWLRKMFRKNLTRKA